VSVNLAPRQVLDDDLVETVRLACDQSGADPAGLMLEITENALIGPSASPAAGSTS
jgi:EAL domain-containing protein (putative c-di-GMP-specific phosphodiesterase class I)